MIDFLISATLYTATYLSFVRLLRYPRNWCLPTLPASLTTVSLATFTAAYVSMSSIGLDLAALSISTGFIVVLFSIIAAPAVDFRPGAHRPVIEFIAKHGDYAGICMLAPAVVAGYTVLSDKLLGVLSVAIAIELTWFSRHRWNGERRRLYPIFGHDLNVLILQAEGDIEGFARRHRIRELELSVDAVGWRGCTKKTLPCPFNLYVHRLGLNTAPCCREHMRELCYYVASCLRDMGVVHWLEAGSLLGAVRENGALLAWEDDIDISVLLDSSTTWKSLVTGLIQRGAKDGYYVNVFKKMGYITISYDRPGIWPFRWERNRMRGEIRLDLAVYRHAVCFGNPVLERRTPKGAMPLTESGGYGVPREIVLPTTTIAFLGGEIACPNRPEAYLRIPYGDFQEIEYTYLDTGAAETRRIADKAESK